MTNQVLQRELKMQDVFKMHSVFRHEMAVGRPAFTCALETK